MYQICKVVDFYLRDSVKIWGRHILVDCRKGSPVELGKIGCLSESILNRVVESSIAVSLTMMS